MTGSESWTIGRLLQWTAAYLRDHGAEHPRLDAEVLLAHVRGCQRIELYTAFDQVTDEGLRSEFRRLVKQRAEGTPVAYLVGYREFYSLRFRVTPDVLIPRPETEFVLVTLLDLAKETRQASQPLQLADVGTGCGNLAIAAAIHLPQSEVTAIDISPAALEVAADNARQHGTADRVRCVASDLFDRLPPDTQFDYIIANPPYIGLREKPDLPRDVVHYEPHLALFAGETGIDVLARLIAASTQRLRPGGRLISEISPLLKGEVIAQVARHPELQDAAIRDDLARLPRVLSVRRRL